MEKKREKIKANQKMINEIAEKYNVTPRTIRSALSFATKGIQADIYRTEAIDRGCKYECMVETEYPYKLVRIS